jgi:hypothetical protein
MLLDYAGFEIDQGLIVGYESIAPSSTAACGSKGLKNLVSDPF